MQDRSFNRNLLCQKAKALLEQAKTYAAPSQLYLLQLMLWGLVEGEVNVPDHQHEYLVDQTVELLGWDQGRALVWLQGDNTDPLVEPADLKGKSPKEASEFLLDHLSARMAGKLGWWPPASPPGSLRV